MILEVLKNPDQLRLPNKAKAERRNGTQAMGGTKEVDKESPEKNSSHNHKEDDSHQKRQRGRIVN